jgi:hypothetical protein
MMHFHNIARSWGRLTYTPTDTGGILTIAPTDAGEPVAFEMNAAIMWAISQVRRFDAAQTFRDGMRDLAYVATGRGKPDGATITIADNAAWRAASVTLSRNEVESLSATLAFGSHDASRRRPTFANEEFTE